MKNAPDYDQAARNVACMAQILYESGRTTADIASIGFFVLAPESQIVAGVFAREMTKASIQGSVEQRINAYDSEIRSKKMAWYDTTFLPFLSVMSVSCLSWESIIAHMIRLDPPTGNAMSEFYKLCLHFNEKSNISR